MLKTFHSYTCLWFCWGIVQRTSWSTPRKRRIVHTVFADDFTIITWYSVVMGVTVPLLLKKRTRSQLFWRGYLRKLGLDASRRARYLLSEFFVTDAHHSYLGRHPMPSIWRQPTGMSTTTINSSGRLRWLGLRSFNLRARAGAVTAPPMAIPTYGVSCCQSRSATAVVDTVCGAVNESTFSNCLSFPTSI